MRKKRKISASVIIFTIIALLLLGLEFKLKYQNTDNEKEDVISWEEEKKLNERNIDEVLSDDDKKFLEQTILGEDIKQNFNYPDKEEIHYKIINSIDNFKTASGEFVCESPKVGSYSKFEFWVDTENKKSKSIEAADSKKPITLIYNNDKKNVFDDNDNTFREFEKSLYNEKPILVRPIRLFLNAELMRADTDILGVSNYIISPDIYGNLFIYKDWDYVESKFLGRDAYKLDGIIDERLSTQNKGKFTLFVDKETGIILQFLAFDENEQVKYKIECTKLTINEIIDSGIFLKDQSGYIKK